MTVKELIEKLSKVDSNMPFDVSIFSKDRDRNTKIYVSGSHPKVRVEQNEYGTVEIDVFSEDYFDDQPNYLED